MTSLDRSQSIIHWAPNVLTIPFPADFGIVLGCKIYVKEITNRSLMNEKDGSLQEGDIIHKVCCDMAASLMDGAQFGGFCSPMDTVATN